MANDDLWPLYSLNSLKDQNNILTLINKTRCSLHKGGQSFTTKDKSRIKNK